MNISSIARLALLSAIAGGSAGAWANSYTIVDLGANRIPTGINGDGSIAATHQQQGKRFRAVVMKDSRWHQLSAPTPAIGQAIDRDDSVAGGSTEHRGLQQPYTWSADGVRHDFELPGSSDDGFIESISNGQVAGWYRPRAGNQQCFVGSSLGGKAQDISMAAGASLCEPFGINSAGQVVGWAWRPAGGTDLAFSWQNGSFSYLPNLEGGSSIAYAVNDAGLIVGYSETANFEHRACLWKDGVVSDIGESTRFGATYAEAINNRNEIVGRALHSGAHHYRAVRFEDGKVIELIDEVQNRGAWKLDEATGVNDSGVIVGWGVLDGQQHGFMLIPQ